jgi:hypothetical protein
MGDIRTWEWWKTAEYVYNLDDQAAGASLVKQKTNHELPFCTMRGIRLQN